MSHADFIFLNVSGAGITHTHMEKKSKKMAQANIINQLIEKGGLYGDVAQLYKNDPVKSHAFIVECSEQCWHKFFFGFWGVGLAMEISEYTDKNHKISRPRNR